MSSFEDILDQAGINRCDVGTVEHCSCWMLWKCKQHTEGMPSLGETRLHVLRNILVTWGQVESPLIPPALL